MYFQMSSAARAGLALALLKEHGYDSAHLPQSSADGAGGNPLTVDVPEHQVGEVSQLVRSVDDSAREVSR
ncbi:MAG: hypothetical protein AVDCRST_MAG72-2298 [uncultured Nocardioidaceae bacterium]|uniref:Uncharacterized protein n=1 Tax=uncultured Nocardioidaceae bacterium TaxID=253824 RepID=A0A6J4MJU5_9ACTN|nr:MAG: hypothetical protein AVDCRST_MAG72-2298 [uncultured Nocardioidaceae bacterium]